LLGQWSWNPGKNISGTFLLTMTPKRDVMYGYFTSFKNNNQIVYKRWILARDEKLIDVGKDLLNI